MLCPVCGLECAEEEVDGKIVYDCPCGWSSAQEDDIEGAYINRHLDEE
ncbi:hypothetical protein [Methanobrevibacter curvatus]|jgi:hypothetical protein|uniref:Uncharacterized protein n=1 Tax=Methanobrevibacter curvatus TaxID=49547 RepID=A0A166A8D5_9EURY|nr:hypothetical protein [Methanobrevibacter curvatus]KZX11709.1 hypothetical protein MBCUR_12940 [Methanobrevibacter curvatus]MDR3062957.1 hypothetical protein [Methanobrevibacter sp.]